MVCHKAVNGPRHYLEKSAIKRWRQAISVGGASASGMEIIHVHASPHDRDKFFKGVPPFWSSGLVGSQIARNNMRERTWSRKSSEVSAATQVGRLMDPGRLIKVGISTVGKFGTWTRTMTTIAIGLCIDNVAAQSHQFPIFVFEIQRYRGDL